MEINDVVCIRYNIVFISSYNTPTNSFQLFSSEMEENNEPGYPASWAPIHISAAHAIWNINPIKKYDEPEVTSGGHFKCPSTNLRYDKRIPISRNEEGKIDKMLYRSGYTEDNNVELDDILYVVRYDASFINTGLYYLIPAHKDISNQSSEYSDDVFTIKDIMEGLVSSNKYLTEKCNLNNTHGNVDAEYHTGVTYPGETFWGKVVYTKLVNDVKVCMIELYDGLIFMCQQFHLKEFVIFNPKPSKNDIQKAISDLPFDKDEENFGLGYEINLPKNKKI